jgi:hypothetical protein
MLGVYFLEPPRYLAITYISDMVIRKMKIYVSIGPITWPASKKALSINERMTSEFGLQDTKQAA